MPRVPRRFQIGDAVCFHVMDRGHNREAILVDDTDRRAFPDLFARYRERGTSAIAMSLHGVLESKIGSGNSVVPTSSRNRFLM
jgi:hypothetical protein